MSDDLKARIARLIREAVPNKEATDSQPPTHITVHGNANFVVGGNYYGSRPAALMPEERKDKP